MSFEDDFNAEEFRRSLERDLDNQAAYFTKAQHRELMEMLEDRRSRKWAIKLLSACAKWIVVVGAGVASLQIGWANISRWLAK